MDRAMIPSSDVLRAYQQGERTEDLIPLGSRLSKFSSY